MEAAAVDAAVEELAKAGLLAQGKTVRSSQEGRIDWPPCSSTSDVRSIRRRFIGVVRTTRGTPRRGRADAQR
jgi:hypothetical protein